MTASGCTGGTTARESDACAASDCVNTHRMPDEAVALLAETRCTEWQQLCGFAGTAGACEEVRGMAPPIGQGVPSRHRHTYAGAADVASTRRQTSAAGHLQFDRIRLNIGFQCGNAIASYGYYTRIAGEYYPRFGGLI
jgi:hypothetical protein